ncbi:MAG: hypothetical protein QW767_01805 [Thermoprotei archaeon]
MSAFEIYKGPATGLVELRQKRDVEIFLKMIVDYYSFNVTKYADLLGELMRQPKNDGTSKRRPAKSPAVPKGVFTMIKGEQNPAALELMVLKIHEELKEKLSRAQQAQKTFESSTDTPENADFRLVLRDGVPLVLVTNPARNAATPFTLDMEFKVSKWVPAATSAARPNPPTTSQ